MAAVGTTDRVRIDRPELEAPGELIISIARAVVDIFSRMGGCLYDCLPQRAARPVFTFLSKALLASLLIVPTLEVVAAVKITYIALSIFAISMLFFLFDCTLLRRSSEELNDRLVRASGAGNLLCVRLFLSLGARTDHQHQNVGTALMQAAGIGHIPVMRELLAAGANVNQEITILRSWRTTALYHAALGGRTEAASLLLAAGADVNHRSGVDNHRFIEDFPNLFGVYNCPNDHDRLRTMRLFLEQGMDATPTFPNEQTLLMRAIIDQHPLEEIGLLIPYQDLSARDSQGFTALDHARRSQREDVVRLLTEQGALPGADLAQRAAARAAETSTAAS